ncbi:MAG: FKBP-type peptidyl-prolyl cis-trans isomerase [Thermoplasmata archaeon]|nr:FKBP-type peptidyl-prolyl cis-trans isomerase [Thermoplasmata archaeon]
MNELVKGIIALLIIVGVAGGMYAYDMWKESQPLYLQKGDFAELYYIGYFDNGTVFASSFVGENVSYDTPFDEKNYTLEALKVYMGNDIPKEYPEGWSYSDIGTIKRMKIPEIKGLYKALLGMKEGEKKIIKLNASDAFGRKVVEGIKFNTSVLFGFKAEFEIIAIDSENESVDLKWIPKIGQRFTMPQYWYIQPITEPYWLWKNATEVVSFNETNVTLKVTPNELHNITVFPWWENASSVGYNDSKIWITTTPPLGNFTIYWGNYEIPGKVLNVTEDKITVWLKYGENETTQEINRTEYFDRVITLPRIFKNFPQLYIQDDLNEIGYSFHELAGKDVTFRVKLLKIYRLGD